MTAAEEKSIVARPVHALAAALGVAQEADVHLETVNVDGAAALLHTTRRGIYVRRQRGQMPTPITSRPLVWRKADLLASGR